MVKTMHELVELFRLEQEIQRAKIQGQHMYAIQLYDQIIQLKSQLPNKLGLAKTIAEKAFLLEQLGQRQPAIDYYSSAIKIAEKTPNRDFLDHISSRLNSLL